MAIIRTIPRKGRRPAHTGRVVIDTVRGVLRVRKWPRKRPGPRTAIERWWTDWFVQANLLAKYADGMSQARAIQMTKGSGMYPRDVLLKAMRGRLYAWTTPDGWKWYSMAAVGDITESLDVLGQTVGDILVRALDRWRPPPPGNLGDVLTNAGPGAPPAWAAAPAPTSSLGCLLTHSIAQSIPNNAFTVLTWDSETYDDASFHDAAVNPTRITMPVGAERVLFQSIANWAANAGGNYRQVRVIKNGSGVVYDGRPHQMVGDLLGGTAVIMGVYGGIIPVVATDYFEVEVKHNAGVALNVNAANSCFGCIINP